MKTKLLNTFSLLIVLLFSTSTLGQTLAKNESLEVLTWNLEWFGSNEKGPKNDQKQMEFVFNILKDLGAPDVIVFEEICNSNLFKRLADTAGYNYYLTPGPDNVQKIGMFYSKNLNVTTQPKLILESDKSTFAGRLPVEITLQHPEIGDFTVIGLHFKANIPMDSYDKREDSYQRRKKSAKLIEEYVNQNLSSKKVIILGDWNDDVDVSNHDNKETAFRNLIDNKDYRFVTYYLSFAMVKSSTHGSVIDHICISNELYNSFRSSAVIDVKDNYKTYIEECSDHYPVYVVFE